MTPPDFEAFNAAARAAGFDEVIERTWPPAAVLDTHSHPFALEAIVIAGEMWLIVGESTRYLRAGDRFAIERDILHAERYGANGATYWVARRN